MRSDKRKKKGLNNVPRGQRLEEYNVEPEAGTGTEEYNVEPEAGTGTEEYNIENPTPVTEEDTQDLGIEVNNEESLSSSESIPVGNAEDYNTEKNISARFFGFIRNKYDDAVDDWKMKKEMKQQAYEKFLEQKPKVYQRKYENQYNRELAMMQDPSLRQKEFVKNFADFSGKMNTVGKFLGGSVTPDKVMGFRGTVLGPLPTGSPSPIPQQMMNQPPQLQRGMYAQERGQHTGSMVENITPLMMLARVTTRDRFGKKRSAVRRISAERLKSGMGMVSPTVQGPTQMDSRTQYPGMNPRPSMVNVTPQQQGIPMNTNSNSFMNLQSSGFGMGFNPDRLISSSQLARDLPNLQMGLGQGQAEQIAPSDKIRRYLQ